MNDGSRLVKAKGWQHSQLRVYGDGDVVFPEGRYVLGAERYRARKDGTMQELEREVFTWKSL